MAALYLHNSIFPPQTLPHANTFSPHHQRGQSSTVTVTPSFRNSLSDFSHPTEPLLHPDTSGSLAYADLLSRQPTHPRGPQRGWDMGLSLVGDPPTLSERREAWTRAVKKRLRRLHLMKGVLELLMGEHCKPLHS